MVAPEKVPRWMAKVLAYYWMKNIERHRRKLNGVSNEEINRLERQFNEWGRQKMHSREIEIGHMEFVRLYREREAMLTAQRKAKKWKARAEEAGKTVRRRRSA